MHFRSIRRSLDVAAASDGLDALAFQSSTELQFWFGTRTHTHGQCDTPRLYYKPAPPLRLPRHNDLLGLHRLNMGMEKYYASPAESRRPVAVAPLYSRLYVLWRRFCFVQLCVVVA